jgi:TonB family protein
VQTESRAPIRPETEEKITTSGAVTHEDIHQVLPDVPQKARDTIQGTVRVSVKVSVDPSGRVIEATLDSSGPSRYFANLALQAALHWTFGPANAASPSSPREWILHFAFSSADTRARSVQAVP